MEELKGVFRNNFSFETFKTNSSKARFFAVFSTVLFALTNICVKIMLRMVHPMQLVGVCGSFLLIFSLYSVTTARSELTLGTLCKCDVFILSVTGFLLLGVTNLENFALSMVNAGDSITVQYGSEILTACSVTCIVLNRGQLTLIRCFIVFTSFLGIFFVVRQDHSLSYQETPSHQSTQGLFISAGSGAGYALFYTFVIILTDRGFSLHLTMLVQSLFLVLGTMCLSFFYFQDFSVPDSFYDWTIFMTCGGLEAVGTMTSLRALATDQLLSVSVILAFEVALTYFFELLVLHTVPTLPSVVGAMIVTFSCIGMISLEDDGVDRMTKEAQYTWLPPFPFPYVLKNVYVTDTSLP